MLVSFERFVFRPKKKEVEKRICYAIIDRIDKMQVGHCNRWKKPSDLPVNARNGCQLCLQYQLHLLLPHHRRSFFGSYSFHFFRQKEKN